MPTWLCACGNCFATTMLQLLCLSVLMLQSVVVSGVEIQFWGACCDGNASPNK
jgi:hypothetical protein